MNPVAIGITAFCTLAICVAFPLVALFIATSTALSSKFDVEKIIGEQGDNWRGFVACLKGIWS